MGLFYFLPTLHMIASDALDSRMSEIHRVPIARLPGVGHSRVRCLGGSDTSENPLIGTTEPETTDMRDESNPAYQYMPDDVASDVPRLYATQNEDDPLARVKLFTPDSSWTWYVVEYSPDDRLCFGLVVGHDRELGYFSLHEIEEIRGPMGLPVERDLHWTPSPVSECE